MDATQRLRVMQQGLDLQHNKCSSSNWRKRSRRPGAPSRSNSRNGETVSASALEDERVRTPTLRSFCTMPMVEDPTDGGSVCYIFFGSSSQR